jgi:hypothetical protein
MLRGDPNHGPCRATGRSSALCFCELRRADHQARWQFTHQVLVQVRIDATRNRSRRQDALVHANVRGHAPRVPRLLEALIRRVSISTGG